MQTQRDIMMQQYLQDTPNESRINLLLPWAADWRLEKDVNKIITI